VIRILAYLRQHALALLALTCSLLAMAGSSYAAFTISGTQIRNHTIDPVKMNPRFVNGEVRAWAVVGRNGNVIAGRGGPRVTLQDSIPGAYGIRWRLHVAHCATDATIDEHYSPPTEQVPVPGDPSVSLTAGYAVGATVPRAQETLVQTFNQWGQPTPLSFDVLVIC